MSGSQQPRRKKFLPMLMCLDHNKAQKIPDIVVSDLPVHRSDHPDGVAA
jgi:hypothetical protein